MIACASTGSPRNEVGGAGDRSDWIVVEKGMEEELMDLEGTVEEHLKILLRQESAGYPLSPNYLAKAANSPIAAKDRVSEAWRRKLCEWCFEVVDHFNYDREVVFFALNYLDRAAAVKSEMYQDAIPKRDYQLLAVTSLYMAIKLHGETDDKEGPRRKLRITAFVELSRGFFSVDVIETSERDILETLKWRVNPPTCLRFMTSLFPLCPKWISDEEHPALHSSVIGGIYDVARYLTELSVCVSSFAFVSKTSVTAYAAILCAIETLQSSLPLPNKVRICFLNNISEATGFHPSDDDVLQVCSKLKELCPSMFDAEPSLPEFIQEQVTEMHRVIITHADHGKISPVSIVDAPVVHHYHTHHIHDQDDSPRSHRKRSCPTSDEPTRPLHRSSF